MKSKSQTRSLPIFDETADHRTYDEPPDTEVPPEVRLVPIVDMTLGQCQLSGKDAFRPPPRDSGGRKSYCIHPSQAQGCQRQVQFVLVGAQEDSARPDPQRERIFAMGHQAHERIQGYLFEAWRRKVGGVKRVWEDVKLAIAALLVSGELDAIVQIRYWRYLVEVKTASQTVFRELYGPKVAWVWQAHIYMRAVGLKAAIILVENRSNGAMKEFWVPFDDEIWSEIEDQALDVLIATERQHVIEQNPEAGECHWCDYRTLCESVSAQKRINWGPVLKEIERASV